MYSILASNVRGRGSGFKIENNFNKRLKLFETIKLSPTKINTKVYIPYYLTEYKSHNHNPYRKWRRKIVFSIAHY
jgi:hypothetical protein